MVCKVDAYLAVHDDLIIQRFLDKFGYGDVVEDYDDAGEGFKG